MQVSHHCREHLIEHFPGVNVIHGDAFEPDGETLLRGDFAMVEGPAPKLTAEDEELIHLVRDLETRLLRPEVRG